MCVLQHKVHKRVFHYVKLYIYSLSHNSSIQHHCLQHGWTKSVLRQTFLWMHISIFLLTWLLFITCWWCTVSMNTSIYIHMYIFRILFIFIGYGLRWNSIHHVSCLRGFRNNSYDITQLLVRITQACIGFVAKWHWGWSVLTLGDLGLVAAVRRIVNINCNITSYVGIVVIHRYYFWVPFVWSGYIDNSRKPIS